MSDEAKILESVHEESGHLVEGTQEADASGKGGLVTIDLIREGFGNQRDNHYYSGELLEREAPKFVGAQMYANHLSPEVEKKLGGLPRDIQDLMGRIRETEVVTDESGKKVIRGKASISQPWLWNMVEHDPELLGVSINARGSSVEGLKEGRTAKIVEAINNIGSVDWVTKAGAGGKVVSLMEAQAQEEATAVAETTPTPAATPPAAAPAPAAAAPAPAAPAAAAPAAPAAETPAEPAPPATPPATPAEPPKETPPAETPPPATPETPPAPPATPAEPQAAVPPAAPAAPQEGDVDWLEDDETVEFDAEVEAEIERRAAILAERKLREGVKAAVELTKEETQRQLTEAVAARDAYWQKRVAQVEQRHVAAGIIEAADFKPATTKALKEEFHDEHFEDELNEANEVVKTGDQRLREAVAARIEKKRQEVAEYSETRVSEAGETTTEPGGGAVVESAPSGEKPTRAPLDEKLNETIGV